MASVRSVVVLTVVVVALRKLISDFRRLSRPVRHRVLETGELKQETRPWSDVLLHMFIFLYIRPLTKDGVLFQYLLTYLNRKFLTWDQPFAKQGKDPATEVRNFCTHWGVPLLPWVWSKPAEAYKTANEFFTRMYAPEYDPTKTMGKASIVTPSQSVVTWFASVQDMPTKLKNDDFLITDIGLPDPTRFMRGSVEMAGGCSLDLK